MSLFAELQKRRVLRTVAAYAIGCFVILWLLDSAAQPLGIDQQSIRETIVAMAIGFPIVAYLSWAFDLMPGNPGAGRTTHNVSMWAVLLTGLAIVAFGFSAWWVLRSESQASSSQASAIGAPVVAARTLNLPG